MAALHLSGTSERTQASSIRAGRLWAQCDHKAPDRLAAQELQRSCLHRTKVDHLAPAAMRLCDRGLRFFSQHVLTRDWATLSLRRAHTAPHRPAVRRLAEVRRVRQAAPPVPTQVSCTTVSRLGRRLHEALCLQVSARDGQRLQGHGHRGQGATDREVPRPAETLPRLRTSWTTPRHPAWLVPAPGRAHPHRPTAPSPMRRSRGHGAVRTAQPRASSPNRGVALPPRRHASAPPLLAAGVHPRLIPPSLGPPQLATTLLSLPLPHPGPADASTRLHARLHGRLP